MSDLGVPDRLEKPVVHAQAWVAPGAVLVGRVTVRRGASIWYGCVLRSDFDGAEIEIGEDSNIQDGTLVHVDENMPCRVGARVTVGHGAILHAATIGDDCLVGMGAIVLSEARIGAGSIVAAGAVVPERAEVPPGVLVAGVPARVRRAVTDEDRAHMKHGTEVYSRLKDIHRDTTLAGDK
jgi:carbonic anhydrase/acetyltransferase-like protein (isoleucine patch superfamily)